MIGISSLFVDDSRQRPTRLCHLLITPHALQLTVAEKQLLLIQHTVDKSAQMPRGSFREIHQLLCFFLHVFGKTSHDLLRSAAGPPWTSTAISRTAANVPNLSSSAELWPIVNLHGALGLSHPLGRMNPLNPFSFGMTFTSSTLVDRSCSTLVRNHNLGFSSTMSFSKPLLISSGIPLVAGRFVSLSTKTWVYSPTALTLLCPRWNKPTS